MKSITVNVTQKICHHNLVAEAMAVALKVKGFADVEIDTGTLPSGRRSVVRIP